VKTYLIYALYHNKIPFYIGQTHRFTKRIRDHRYQAKWGNPLWVYNKIRKLWKNNEDFEVKVLERGLTLEEANEREKFFVSLHKDLGYQLCNLTDGGDGNAGHVCPESIKELLRKIKTGKSWGKHSEETKKKLSENRKGIVFSEAHKEKLALARRKRVISDSTRAKASQTSKGKINIKVVTLIAPDGTEHCTVEGITVFCEKNGLTAPNIIKVLAGKRAQHKGWRAKNA
jgi:group I intron endonuclease